MRDVVLELLPGRLADEFETGIFHRDAPAESVSSRAEESASSRADMSAEISSSSRADMSSAHVQCGDDWLTVPLGGRADAGGGVLRVAPPEPEAVGKAAAGTSFMLQKMRSLRPHTLVA